MTPAWIKRLRLSLKMTQEEFARKLGLTHRSTVCHWERGTKRPAGPALVLLELLAEIEGQKDKGGRNR